ncbi:MAG TPA: substrate-binding domain-containing protein [Candidatus Dormibacteraeota bacterium]|nr:substrate-binding domain-containing protein [Candidatus Dormibacteraeota bacterium]
MAGARQPALAQAFVELLLGREGQAVLGRFGFQPPPAGVR